jgi:hypothetical protein
MTTFFEGNPIFHLTLVRKAGTMNFDLYSCYLPWSTTKLRVITKNASGRGFVASRVFIRNEDRMQDLLHPAVNLSYINLICKIEPTELCVLLT